MPEGGVGNSQVRMGGREAGLENMGGMPHAGGERERRGLGMVRVKAERQWLGAPDSTQTLGGGGEDLDSILRARRVIYNKK